MDNSSRNLPMVTTITANNDLNSQAPKDIVYIFLLLCFIPLLIAHIYALLKSNYHKLWISPYTLAIILQALSIFFIVLDQYYYVQSTHNKQIEKQININITQLSQINLFNLGDSGNHLNVIGRHIYVVSINIFILFLLAVAKGWPITRRDIPSRNAFLLFWLLCTISDIILNTWTIRDSLKYGSAKAYHSLPKRLALVLRAIIMIYFLLELRTTMILEQEQKKLKFYLHFGALSMVWFVHPQIVYLIALRVSEQWQPRLLREFTSVADFLSLVAITYMLWPSGNGQNLFSRSNQHSFCDYEIPGHAATVRIEPQSFNNGLNSDGLDLTAADVFTNSKKRQTKISFSEKGQNGKNEPSKDDERDSSPPRNEQRIMPFQVETDSNRGGSGSYSERSHLKSNVKFHHSSAF